VVAEGAFGAELAERDVAFEDVLGVGGDFEVDGLALDQLDGLAAEEAGDEVLLDLGRRGDDGGEGGRGIGADGDGDLHAAFADLGEGGGGDGCGGRRGGAAGGEGHDVDAGGGRRR
jgi:hypothetical protein